MDSLRHQWQRVGSVTFMLAALALLFFALYSPEAAAEHFQSQRVALLLAGWCIFTAMLLQSEFIAGLAQGVRDFRRASEEVRRNMGGDDDDNGPRAA